MKALSAWTKAVPSTALWTNYCCWMQSSHNSFQRRETQQKELPLFPALDGGFCDKVATVETICRAGDLLGVPRQSASGSERISGHSLRATGSQGLARMGLDLWAIQLLGRWGSDKVRSYVRSAQAESAAVWATQAAKQTDLEDLLSALQAKLKTSTTDAASSSTATSQLSTTAEVRLLASTLSSTSTLDKNDIAQELQAKALRVAEAQTAPDDSFVISGKSTRGLRIWHKVTRGPPLWEMGDWSTQCGWNFARPSKGSRAKHDTQLSTGPLPDDRNILCKSCFPGERGILKASAQQRLVEQVGEVPAQLGSQPPLHAWASIRVNNQKQVGI